MPWGDMQRIVAYTRPDEMGGAHCLAVERRDGSVLEVMDSVTATDDAFSNLGAYLTLEISPNVWRARLLSEPETRVVIYDRNDAALSDQ